MTSPDAIPQREFESLLQGQLSLAFNVAYRTLGSREEAEDVVQSAAIRAWRSLASYQTGTNFKAWFLKIVVNLALNAKRDATRRPATVNGESEEGEGESLFEKLQATEGLTTSEPATAFLAKLQTQDIHEALGRLPEDFRVVAVLHFLEEMSYEQIAEVVGVPLGTVRSRLHRARRLLQRELWETAREMGIATGEPEEKPARKKRGSLLSFLWI